MAFDAIHSSLQSDPTERKDLVKKGNAIFAFTLKNKQGQTESWYIDLKEKGEVAKGKAPEGRKADGQSQYIASDLSTSKHRGPSKLHMMFLAATDTKDRL